ncbi:3-keto-L-gulonate-6-phosphate decarboxylase [Fructobacillus pseudoficulneus]|uniref:3-hexulose-6-phosphate synthase n=1 Tax=Fructobacillus pseudoficulneus TaxID=220714 RepID=A0A3F3GWF9_9LACO|nr:3-dehydro-L-gulonate-6-phosphate decarboxylase [Fructobacillus pseudoficulneus]GAP02562.1 3-keto-L-gulonate-6-phosphate decarboxylase [Fructobacillus pseudoficulneus]SEH38219.1 3-hexulose-6-phosphate synthase [Fructobacillus pseudoficulneus]
MKKPKLQLALDQNSLPEAVAVAHLAGPIVDIVEVGTILELQAGQLAIQTMRKMLPDKMIVSDTKCADAGTTVAENSSKAGADLMTVIDSATQATMQAAKKVMLGIQVELYSAWDFKRAAKWLELGIDQVIYHQSRDALLAGKSWGEQDLTTVRQLIEMGFKVSVTGGLTLKTIPLFAGLAVETFIAGRAITGNSDVRAAAQAFQDKIIEHWGTNV